jgi:hypothetical protein
MDYGSTRSIGSSIDYTVFALGATFVRTGSGIGDETGYAPASSALASTFALAIGFAYDAPLLTKG